MGICFAYSQWADTVLQCRKNDSMTFMHHLRLMKQCTDGTVIVGGAGEPPTSNKITHLKTISNVLTISPSWCVLQALT